MESRNSRRGRLAWGVAGLAAALLLPGCGVYSTSSGRLDASLRHVAVPFLENRSTEPGIEVELTDLIVQALRDDNTLKVTDEEHADTILRGQVLRYALQEVFTRPDADRLQVDEYQVQILVELSLIKRVSAEALFEKRRITGTGNFILDDPDGGGEAGARALAAGEIVRDVLALIVEDW